jgi:HlyD family secretion protein
MFTENAATKRQVDEVEGKVNVYKNRLRVWKLKMHQSNEAKSIDVQIAKINDQIEKSKIPTIKGTVLAKYAEQMKSPLSGSHFIKLPIFLK